MADADTPEGVRDPADPAALVQAAQAMLEQVQVLTEQVTLLREELAEFRAKTDRNIADAQRRAVAEVATERKDRRRAAWKFAAVVVLDIVLSGVSLGLWIDQRSTDAQVRQTQHTVLCPLYRILLSAVTAPQPGSTPQQAAIRDAALATIRKGYGTLHCEPPLTGG